MNCAKSVKMIVILGCIVVNLVGCGMNDTTASSMSTVVSSQVVQKSLVLVSENMTGTENQKQSPVIISPLPHSVFSFSGSAGSDLTEQAQLQCQLTPILQKPVWYTCTQTFPLLSQPVLP